jgi:hypothetical protein
VGSSCNCTVQAASGLTVTGRGNAEDPYIVSLALPFSDRVQDVAGSLDLSAAAPGSFIEVTLSADVTDVDLPDDAGGRVELLIHNDGSGSTITWPSNIWWPGGTPPVLSATAGQSDWIDLRRLGTNWVGRQVATEIG